MGHVCQAHSELSAEHGGCAPLHIPEHRTPLQIKDQQARDHARKLAKLLTEYADWMHAASVAERHGDTVSARSARAQARATFHLHPELSDLLAA